jgi:hypothetical protein
VAGDLDDAVEWGGGPHGLILLHSHLHRRVATTALAYKQFMIIIGLCYWLALRIPTDCLLPHSESRCRQHPDDRPRWRTARASYASALLRTLYQSLGMYSTSRRQSQRS